MSKISLDKLSHKKKSSTVDIVDDQIGLIFICGGPTTQVNEVNCLEDYILINLSLKYIGGNKNPLLIIKIAGGFFIKFPDTIKSFVRDFIKFYETLERNIIQKQCFIIGVVINNIFFDSLTFKKQIKKIITFNYFFELAQLFFKKILILSYIVFLCCLKIHPLI